MGARLWLAVATVSAAALTGAVPASATHLDAPVLTPPADVTVVATTPCASTECAVVTYAYTITGGTAPYQLSCNIASGSSVAIGTYAVTCTATDAANVASASSSFTLRVVPPTLSIAAPADTTVEATLPCRTNEDCAIVTYSYTVTGGYPPYNLICNLPSGSVLPVGSYTISCLAQDSAGDSTANATFNLTVTLPSSPPVVPAGPSYQPDVTGCAVSTCMANSLTGFQIDGVTCDFGSFNWSKTSYSCAGPATVSSPITVVAGNQTGDVSIGFQANGAGVGVASAAATGQQSGITYTSAAITPADGTNTITISVDDPLGRLPATVYTATFDYSPPDAAPATTTTTTVTTTTTATTSGGAGAASSGSSSGRSAPAPTGSAAGSRGSTSTATETPTSVATLSTTSTQAAATAPSITSRSGRQSLSFAVRLPRAGRVTGTLVDAAGQTLLRFHARERAGRTVVRRLLRTRILHGARLTLRVVLRTGGTTRTRTLRFRA